MLSDSYRDCRDQLERGGIENPAFEAQCMLEHLTGYNRAAQLAHGGEPFAQQKALDEMVRRRLRHEPLQYILGSWSFCGFPLSVGEGVLIPRDDTEVVLGLCLDYLKKRRWALSPVYSNHGDQDNRLQRRDPAISNHVKHLPDAVAADLCSGSGALAIALSKIAGARVTAVELSKAALPYLIRNVQENEADVTVMEGDVLHCHTQFQDESLDLIVSNPPYIRSADIAALQDEVQFEPRMALDGGESGYDFYEALIPLWKGKLKRGGALAFELGEGQAETVGALMKAHGFENIRTAEDFGGIQRAIIGTVL